MATVLGRDFEKCKQVSPGPYSNLETTILVLKILQLVTSHAVFRLSQGCKENSAMLRIKINGFIGLAFYTVIHSGYVV